VPRLFEAANVRRIGWSAPAFVSTSAWLRCRRDRLRRLCLCDPRMLAVARGAFRSFDLIVVMAPGRRDRLKHAGISQLFARNIRQSAADARRALIFFEDGWASDMRPATVIMREFPEKPLSGNPTLESNPRGQYMLMIHKFCTLGPGLTPGLCEVHLRSMRCASFLWLCVFRAH